MIPADRQHMQRGKEFHCSALEQSSCRKTQVSEHFILGLFFLWFLMLSQLICFGHFPVCKSCPLSHSKLRFASVSHVFGEVGHTHGPVDQRLSIAVTAFSNEDTIQTPEEALALLLKVSNFHTSPMWRKKKLKLCCSVQLESCHLKSAEDFLKILDTKVSPVKGREMINMMLPGTWNYKLWLDQLGVQISGLTPNARARNGDELRVNHSWRFIRRSETWWLVDSLGCLFWCLFQCLG